MLGYASVWSWLVYSALVSLVILTLGSGVVLLWRQPARGRLRIVELTLIGCLVAPWLSLIPGYPQIAIGPWRSPGFGQSESAIEPPTELAALPANATPRAVSDALSQPSIEIVEARPRHGMPEGGLSQSTCLAWH